MAKIPSGMNHILWIIFPGIASINTVNTPKSFKPLQGSPIQTPWLKFLFLIKVITISECISIEVWYPKSESKKFDCFAIASEIDCWISIVLSFDEKRKSISYKKWYNENQHTNPVIKNRMNL